MGVFLYDLIRATRRGRLALLRTTYALVLLDGNVLLQDQRLVVDQDEEAGA